MMLRHIGKSDVADRIEKAVYKTLSEKKVSAMLVLNNNEKR